MSDDLSKTETELPVIRVARAPAPVAPSMFNALIKRAFRTDLEPGELLPDEHAAIEIEEIHGGSEPLRKALLWRRGALFAALVFLLPATLVHLIRDLIDMGREGASSEISGLAFMATLANIGLCIGVFTAWRRWDVWARSRKILFWSWIIAFVVPFLVALFPLRSLGRGGGQEAALGVLGALSAVIGLAPKALSLVPGVLRAAMTTKVLFPGASAPGWLVLLATPFYLLLLFVVMSMPYQMAGGGLMALSLFAFLAAPIFLVRAGRRLARPTDLATAVTTIHQTRMATLAFNGAGALFLIIGLIDIVSTFKLNPLDAIAPLIGVVANVFVLGVVGVDATLVALIRGHVSHETAEQTAARHGFVVEMDAFIEAAQAGDASQAASRPADPA